MACPFRQFFARSTAPDGSKAEGTDAPTSGPTCPLGFGGARKPRDSNDGATSVTSAATTTTCPLGFSKPKTGGSNDGTSPASSLTATCPLGFSAKAKGGGSQEGVSPVGSVASVCALGFGNPHKLRDSQDGASSTASLTVSPTPHPVGSCEGNHHPEVQAAAPSPAAAASCPYGFGGSSGPKLSALHCILCRTFVHDCVKIERCGHKYCRFCISRHSLCPVCGVDVDGLVPDDETQAMVGKLLDAHRNSEVVAPSLEAFGISAADYPSGTAAFFLQLGLRAAAGGNLVSAYDRLELCKDELLKSQQQQHGVDGATSPSGTAALDEAEEAEGGGDSTSGTQYSAQLGAVYGSQADVLRQLGDGARAESLYRRSMACLRPLAGADSEVSHALTVTINKLGDLCYYRGDLPAARDAYLEALAMRQAWLERAQGRATTAQVLDVGVSLVKAADACSATGQASEAQQHTAAARQLLRSLQHPDASQEGNVADGGGGGSGGGGDGSSMTAGEAAKLAGLLRALDAAAVTC